MIDLIFLHVASAYSYLCPIKEQKLVRLGADNDGGYILPEKLIQRCDHLLSFGIGYDWSFEQQFAGLKPNAQIDAYDASVPNQNFDEYKTNDFNDFFQGRIQHHKEMMGKQSEYTSFAHAVDRMPSGNLLVKMDIEGDEYQSIEDLISYQGRIPGAIIEFHGICADLVGFEKIIRMMQQYYQIVHVHACNCAFIHFTMLPDVIEVTFMRKDMCESTDRRCLSYISNLDSPTNPTKSDYCLLFDI